MVWVVTALVLIGLVAFVLILGWLVFKYVKEAEAHRQAEEFFAEFAYTDDEWGSLYEFEFVEDERGKGFTDKYASVISRGKYEGGVGQKIQFSDRAIYLSGDGERKSYAVNRLNLDGDGVHLLSIRLLPLSPLNKLEVKVKVDIDLADYRVNHDLDYLVPLPRSAAVDIDDILLRYERIG